MNNNLFDYHLLKHANKNQLHSFIHSFKAKIYISNKLHENKFVLTTIISLTKLLLVRGWKLWVALFFALFSFLSLYHSIYIQAKQFTCPYQKPSSLLRTLNGGFLCNAKWLSRFLFFSFISHSSFCTLENRTLVFYPYNLFAFRLHLKNRCRRNIFRKIHLNPIQKINIRPPKT